MPTKTPLTLDDWFAKVAATLPGWWLSDTDKSVIKSHILGMAAVFRAIEENIYDHIDETHMTRCSDDMVDVYAAERLVPDLGYDLDARRSQVRELRSRMHLEGIAERVRLLLNDETVEVIDGYSDETLLEADYDDNEDAVVDWDVVPNFFSVVLGVQGLPSDSFASRASYADRAAYVSKSLTGIDPVTDRVRKVVAHYKGSGFLFRVFQRS